MGSNSRKRSSITLNWHNKDKILLDIDCNYQPCWGQENSFDDIRLKYISSYGEVKDDCRRISHENLDNLLIKGNNIFALKYLEKDFANKIKCVYIDPPFNTGKVFEHYVDGLNSELWLSMLKARLEIIKELLSEDGLVMVHIDDSEMPYLKILMDEIFAGKGKTSGNRNSASNYVATVVWQKKFSPQNDAKFFSDVHDYILIYAKDKKRLRLNLLERTLVQDSRYSNLDNDSRGRWMSSDLTVKTPSPQYIYPITLPSGRTVCPAKSRSWGFPKERFDELVRDNRIWFGKTGDNMPRLKRFLSEVKGGIVPTTLWLRDEVGDNSAAKHELKGILSDNESAVFTTPKPEKLLYKLLKIATDENDWVLDAYLGSGTTCAVAHKLKRRWIGIENGNQMEKICIPRISRIIDGKDNNSVSKLSGWKNGGGFNFYEIEHFGD